MGNIRIGKVVSVFKELTVRERKLDAPKQP